MIDILGNDADNYSGLKNSKDDDIFSKITRIFFKTIILFVALGFFIATPIVTLFFGYGIGQSNRGLSDGIIVTVIIFVILSIYYGIYKILKIVFNKSRINLVAKKSIVSSPTEFVQGEDKAKEDIISSKPIYSVQGGNIIKEGIISLLIFIFILLGIWGHKHFIEDPNALENERTRIQSFLDNGAIIIVLDKDNIDLSSDVLGTLNKSDITYKQDWAGKVIKLKTFCESFSGDGLCNKHIK